MFKNMLKRTWLSVVRKPSRSIIMILIMFVMANMMLATIVIRTSVAESVNYAKESLGGVVYLQPDMEAIREKAMENAGGINSGQPVRTMRPNIPVDTASAIAGSEYVKDWTYTVQGRANASGFTPVETEEQKMRQQINDNSNNSGYRGGPGGGMVMFGGGMMADMNIIGINSFAFISEVESGDMKKAEGEIFDESTDSGVMISYDLASENDIAVGNKIALTTVAAEEDGETQTIELIVIGTYDVTTEGFNTNTIYMNPETAVQFAINEENPDNYGVSGVKYYLTNAEDKDVFLAEATKKFPNLTEESLKLDIDTSAYDQMVGPITSVGSFATTMLVVVIAAAVVIITLIAAINVRERRYEMGVLMSIGASKKNILGEIMLELVIVGTVGFALSIATGSFIARGMGEGLLAQQVEMSEQNQSQNFGRGQNAAGPGMTTMRIGGGPMMSMGGTISDAEPIKEIDVNASVGDYIALFVAGYLIIIASLVVPSANILRLQPKTILTGKE